MPETLTFEEASAPESFSFDEATKPNGFSFEEAQVAPVQAPDLSKIKLSPYQQSVPGPFGESIKPPSGMEAPTGLVTALGTTPVGRTAIAGAETLGGGIKDTAEWLADAYTASQGGQDPMAGIRMIGEPVARSAGYQLGEAGRALWRPVGGLAGESDWDELSKQYPKLMAVPKVVKGMVESTPKMAAQTLLGPEIGPAVWGLTDEGFDAKTAATMYALPWVKNYTGAIAENVATKMGISKPLANQVVNRVAGGTAMAGLLTADQIDELRKLSPEEREKKAPETIGNALAMFAMGTLERGRIPEKPVEAPLPTGAALKMPEGSAVPPKVPFNLPDAAAQEPPVVSPKAEAPAVEGAKANPHDFVPAIQDVAGKHLIGEKGKSHEHILQTQKPEWDDWQLSNLSHVREGEMPGRGFWYKGEFKTRREAADLLGEKDPLHSERLKELQDAAPEPKPTPPPAAAPEKAASKEPWQMTDSEFKNWQQSSEATMGKGTTYYKTKSAAEKILKSRPSEDAEVVKEPQTMGGPLWKIVPTREYILAKAASEGKISPDFKDVNTSSGLGKAAEGAVEKSAAPLPATTNPTEPKPAAPEKGRIDDWITKLESLKSKGGEAGLASFPDPEVFKGIGSALRNTAIDVAIGALKAGKSIGEALDAAMAHIRERSKDFDETKLRAALGAYLYPPETTGIAHRVSEARGMAPERGKGVAPAESVEHGRELLQQGLDPQSVLAVFNKTQAVRADDMAVVRAHLERLSKATNDAADAHGVDSPEYKAAWEAEKDWRAKVKPMQTEWHRIGQAQQGETDIDTGSFTGLQRRHQENTGTDLKPGDKKHAQRIAQTNKDAQGATGEAHQKFNQHIRDKSTGGIPDAEQRAFDAANKTVREWAIKVAEAENKARSLQAGRDRAAARVQAKAAKKALNAANETVRRAAADLADKERKLQGDPTLRVWTKAKEYLDQGIDKLDDIRKKLATDLGMSIEQVTRLMAQDKRAKYLADDLWRKQQQERSLKSQAKRWVDNLSTPGLTKALQSIPRGMFVLKVGLHGTVALGTHAPTVLFQPRFWNAYVRNFGKMYKMVGSRAYYESQVQSLLRADNYTTARRAGLVNDPFVYEEYAMNPVVGGVARIAPKLATAINSMTGMGNRGYSVLKMLRQDMFDQHWNQLPKSMQIPEIAQSIADGVNHATGVVQGRAPAGTNLALFAPRLEASRVMWLAGDPGKAVGTLLNWKNASQGEKYFAMNQLKEKAWVVGTLGSLLALNQGILSASGSDQKVNVSNPFQSDFLKFKAAGMNVSYGNPMITMARLPLRLFVGVVNEGKLNKIVYEDERVATILFEYVRSQMSPFAGTATDLAVGRDYMERPLPRAGFGLVPGKTNIPKRLKAEGIKPYTWKEYAAQQAAMIPLQEALKEVWGKDLMMTPEARKHALDALATIIVMGGTGARLTEDYSLKQKPAAAQPPWEQFRP